MLDRWTLKLASAPVKLVAFFLLKTKITANQLTVTGFVIGLLSIPTLASEHYHLALLFIALNRLLDGLDGALARLTKPTDQGAYLDIVLDFIFYSGVIFGFALANPEANALAAAALIFSFIGTGASFLAFAIFAEKLKLKNMRYPTKGFYYLSGITEGTETLLVFIAMCLLPEFFPQLAWLFFSLCLITTATRVVGGVHTIAAASQQNTESTTPTDL